MLSPDRVETGPYFVPGLPHDVAHAQADPNVVGINPWHWNSWGSFDAASPFKLGARAFPAVRKTLAEIGAQARRAPFSSVLGSRVGKTIAQFLISSSRPTWLCG